MPKDKCVISEVIFKDGNVPPIIAYFENGDLKPETGNIRKCGIFRNNNDPDKYIVAVNTGDNSLYMGSEPSEQSYRTLLAVQNKGSNKMRLIEVDKVALKAKPASSFAQKVIDDGVTVADLYKKFGSKQSKRRTEQKERLAINVESFSERLQNTASSINVTDVLDITNDNDYYGTYLPCNRNATVVSDVYKLDDIISPNELQELDEEASAILSNTPEANAHDYSPFLNENLKILNSADSFFCAKILLYSECLVQFLSMRHSELSRKNVVVCPFSEVINRKILENFTEYGASEGSRNRKIPPSLKQKVLAHVIVTGLMACNYTLHVAPLLGMISANQEKFNRLCRTLGAVPLSKEKKTTLTLKVPLPIVAKPPHKRKKF